MIGLGIPRNNKFPLLASNLRLFGFGRVTVRGTGVAVIEFPPIDSPLRFRRVIEEAAHDANVSRDEN